MTIEKLVENQYQPTAIPPLTRAPVIIKTRSGQREPSEKTQWPRIGNLRDSALKPNPVFDSRDFLRRYDPSGDDLFPYICGSPGTMELGRQLHLPLYKVGLSRVPDLEVRQRQISEDEYGSCRRVGDHWLGDSGFSRYEMHTTVTSFELHPNSPVSLVPRGLRVRLPRALTFDQFHREFQLKMDGAGLNTFLDSAAGRRHLALLGREPSGAMRYTMYRWGNGVRYRLANELYICRPRQDVSRIVLVAEQIVLEHLGLMKI